ncbi:MAG: hypothetical protein U1E65_18825 [Myxococcota bacterium]
MKLRNTSASEASLGFEVQTTQTPATQRRATTKQGLERAAEQAAAKVGDLPSAQPKPGTKVLHAASVAGHLPPANTSPPKHEATITVDYCNYRVGDRVQLSLGAELVPVEIRAIKGQQVTVSEVAKPRSKHEVTVAALKSAPKAPIELIERHGHLAMLLNGQLIGRGDCVRADYPLGDSYISSEMQIRDIQRDAEGKLHVFADEVLGWGGRTRLRELNPRELEGLGRSNYLQKEIRNVLQPIAKELQVVRRGLGTPEPSFRVGKETFLVGDHIKLAAGATEARILHIRSAGGGTPVVEARFTDGSARVLSLAELKSMALDKVELDRRLPDRPSAPRFEVIRPEAGAAYLSIDGARVSPGGVFEYSRGTPGEFPVKLDHIDKDDRVWITELVPLGTVVGEYAQKVSIGGKEFSANFAGPLEELTRPISSDDYYLFRKLPSAKDLQYKTYNYQNLGWATDRAKSGAPNKKPLELFQLRGETVRPGDLVVDRRGGAEKALEIVEILADSGLKVRPAGDKNAAVEQLPIAENLFLFPVHSEDLNVGGVAAHREERNTWEETQTKILDDFAKQNPGHGVAGFAYQGLIASPRMMKAARAEGTMDKVITEALCLAAQLPTEGVPPATLVAGPTARVVDESEQAMKSNPVTNGGLTWAPFRSLRENSTSLGEVFSVKLDPTPTHHGFLGLAVWDEHNGVIRTFAFERDVSGG